MYDDGVARSPRAGCSQAADTAKNKSRVKRKRFRIVK